MKSLLTLVVLIVLYSPAHANDTLYFRISNPWNTVKDTQGKYLRKAIHTSDSGWLTLDYNAQHILVARSYYTDTIFKTKLYCHSYYNEAKGFLEHVRCYKNGQLDGISTGFNEKGDTLWTETYNQSYHVSSKYYPGYDPPGIIFTKVEVESEFPGGRAGWAEYLSKNLRYPQKAIRKRIQGTVVLQFIVDKEGKVSDVSVILSVHPLLDNEAKRMITESPNWTPATQNGRKVKSYKKQPIVFKLE